jgi:predicted RecB family nuclease
VTLDGIELLSKKNFRPVFITPFEKITKVDKIFVALQSALIQNEFNIQADCCHLIYGQNLKQLKFKLPSLIKGTKKIIADLYKTLENSRPPSFVKNSHCSVCEFNNGCTEKLVERDDLSLISSLTAKEMLQKNNKGIFSVRQLSYTFRPKKHQHQNRKSSPELKALALRENKIFINGIPDIKNSATVVFLDIEGLPDRNFYYLIGVIIKTDECEKHYSFWADKKEEEPKIFLSLIKLLEPIDDFIIYHYGSYETQAIKSAAKVLPNYYQGQLKNILDRLFNILHVFTQNIYVPTYSNGLKEIARFLKYNWSEKDASGLQSIIWRYKWELSKEVLFKNTLINYNQEDCQALMLVTNWIKNIQLNDEQIENVNEFSGQTSYKWGAVDFRIRELAEINKMAYFDYQRNKVYIKTNSNLKKLSKKRQNISKSYKILKPNKVIIIPFEGSCEKCNCKSFYKHDNLSRVILDIKITKTGIKRFITQYKSGRRKCKKCNHVFTPEEFMALPIKYGRLLSCWIVYTFLKYRISYIKIAEMLEENLGIKFKRIAIHNIKVQFSDYYKEGYRSLISEIVKGDILHIDETTFSIDHSKGYIWAFTNMETVYYLFTPTRESAFLKKLISDFRGVLISDFYAGYDSLKCNKQRCLIHLIRDINDDILDNQQNHEFLSITIEFSRLLNEIIRTVQRFGLKKRFLKKHDNAVQSFFKKIEKADFQSDISEKWKKRLLNYREELFTFIKFDGVPWNNNNAEVAIKAIALYRRNVEGLPTAKSLQHYLTLLSLQQTCKYRGINFFDFLVSGKRNISG